MCTSLQFTRFIFAFFLSLFRSVRSFVFIPSAYINVCPVLFLFISLFCYRDGLAERGEVCGRQIPAMLFMIDIIRSVSNRNISWWKIWSRWLSWYWSFEGISHLHNLLKGLSLFTAYLLLLYWPRWYFIFSTQIVLLGSLIPWQVGPPRLVRYHLITILHTDPSRLRRNTRGSSAANGWTLSSQIDDYWINELWTRC